jgi:hypothetical protein
VIRFEDPHVAVARASADQYSSSVSSPVESGAHPGPQQQVVYQQIVRPPSNGIAIAGMVLGIVAVALGIWMVIPFLGLVFAFVSFVPAVLAVVFGVVGLRQSNRVQVGRGAAITGLITGGLTLAIGALTTMFWILAIAASAASHSGS